MLFPFEHSEIFLPLIQLLLVVSHPGWGFLEYRDRIPNGKQVPHPCKANYRWRGVGHHNPWGGGARNTFGKDFLRFGAKWTQQLCGMDSDGDGMSNGEELGDPDCVWKEGDLPNRTTAITHPGVCDPWEKARCKLANAKMECDMGDFRCKAVDTDPEVRNVTLRIPSTPVPGQETTYTCMTFDLPGSEVYDLVAVQPALDNLKVMHHMLLLACPGHGGSVPQLSTPTPCGMALPGCTQIVGWWTVGYPGHCQTDGVGFRFGKGLYTRVALQIHWNNPERRTDYRDGSGVTVHYTPRLKAQRAATLLVGQESLVIPPRQPSVLRTGLCSSTCSRRVFSRPVFLTDAFNHMHYMGKSQKIELFHNGRFVSSITHQEVYSYDLPSRQFHHPPVQILPGDELKVTCVYDSRNRNTTVYFGESTSSEMCYGFLTLYPQEALRFARCVGWGEQTDCGQTGNDDGGDKWDNHDGDQSTSASGPGFGSVTPASAQSEEIEGSGVHQQEQSRVPVYRQGS